MALPSKEQKERYVREMFNGIAHKYDLMNTMMSFGQDQSWRRYAIRRAHVSTGMNVLDVCCGTAALTVEIAQTVGETGEVTGLDFAEEMLAIGEQRVQNSGLQSKICLTQGNAMALPFEDNTFDAVTVGWGLRNVPDIDKAISEMYRVVKPGGWVVSLDMAKPTAPVFKQAYWLYFDWLVPLLGKITAGRKGAYQYLHDSSRAFDSQQQLTRRFAKHGFVETAFHNLMGGVVAVVEGKKPER
ncbi:demethylmenaquinone methyltransferase [Alicyclobacillus tolerans]|uniref:demethylmenaquinone methyltransferase n=1 Tax=Alicyclobacillus tolerans TaxID=90970 RepID=UPI001F01DB90|nr:demethylmenaquinone methyltransferase [Alicyclobacillus tolerans]MCF8564286.1 demethylmenaquinone methyltransferase [Alicyclobacillus tolerans]